MKPKLLGETTQARLKSYDMRDTGTLGMLTDPLLLNVRNDPRFKAFLLKLGLPAHA